MIFDNIKNFKKYCKMNAGFEKGFDFIRRAVEENLPQGKYEIDGKNVYASVQEYNAKDLENCKYEGHRNYIDIQYIISGTEIMDFVDISKTEPTAPYNAEKDVTYFAHAPSACRLVVEDGEYAIFMPYDIHRPGIAPNDVSAPVRKVVVKVRV